MIKWLYGARTDAEAAPIVAEARAKGLRFVADNDSRPVGSGNPQGRLWMTQPTRRRAQADDDRAPGCTLALRPGFASPPASRSPTSAARSFRSG